MAFWGVEIKPGNPYTHKPGYISGRLRISQATLGIGNATNKSIVQCNVGNKSPILLCNLIPNLLETVHLELEFEEAEDVVFSVLGKRSVHLSGYYVGSSGGKFDDDSSESYGEDIANSDSQDGYGSSDDDEYESDFIDDDDDIGTFPSSAHRKSGVVIEEIIEDDKPSHENANRRRLKKKHQLSDSDDDEDAKRQLVVKRKGSAVLESEDEDGFPISFSKKKNVAKDSMENSNSKSDDKVVVEEMDISQDGKSTRETSQPSDTLPPSEVVQENNEKSKKKKKKKAKDEKPLGTTSEVLSEENANVETDKYKNDNQVDADKVNGLGTGEANVEPKKDEADEPVDDGNAKQKKKKTKKRRTTEGLQSAEDTNEAANNDPPVNDEVEKLPNQSDSSAAQETREKQKKKNKKKRVKEDRGSDAEGGVTNDVNQASSKKKKKESKINDNDIVPTQESGEEGKAEVSKSDRKTRTYPNGLVIEELAMGKPDGQRATKGKKVSVNYIGKLKNGTIFDSTVGKRPFSFRLGIGQVIKGWDVGVIGMRVGDKRRLTIPPSYGYGQKKTGPIPPNSWLTFDVELVSVK
ncbi:peptidyl-prolyl cis-trans isomerase FKBP43-like isoform X1 [Asparagus officinalis]|uniref:peptidyl-prolyl cis-trans isomerase FKBP43-like isoform X1 n=1 Tax=Asparagus officinalis TaxID=4686 RepID=UPI00098E4507|nr:peptidyl-prolyl cis-trans isomerase FKBP43-like isoform X1 [Asparagus officinalis]